MNRRNGTGGRNSADGSFENSLPTSPSPPSARRLPLSGSEETYTDLVYGSPRGRGNNNCYAYAIDSYSNSGGRKLQPGNASGATTDLDLGSCAALRSRTAADLGNKAYAVDPEAPCRAGHYKVMAFLAKGNDYHWYKQHRDALVRLPDRLRDLAALSRALGVRPSQVVSAGRGRQGRAGDLVLVRDAGLWSHKQGLATGPLLKDSCGKAITDPRKACRKYGDRLNYTDFCGAYCVRAPPGAGRRRAGASASAAASAAAVNVAAANAGRITGRNALNSASWPNRSNRR